MTTELIYLLATTALAASLWIPYIVGVNKHPLEADTFARPPDLRAFPEWVHRAHRAHLNLLEQFLPFGMAVITATALQISTPVIGYAAMAFFWLRVIHAAGMISGTLRFPLRPVVFTLGWISILVIVAQIALSA